MDPARAATHDLAVANYTAHASAFELKQNKLREWLNDQGIDTTAFFAYEAYNAELYHAWKTTAGDSLVTTATNLVAKYVAQGLDEADLIDIALNVYTVTVPPAEP